MTSIGIQQQRLARFSLRLASATLAGYVTDPMVQSAGSSTARLRQLFPDRMCCGLLLTACALGRTGLGILRALTWAIPVRMQLWTSEHIVSGITHLLASSGIHVEPMRSASSAEEEAPIDPLRNGIQADASTIADQVHNALCLALPNDLSRMIYVATIRDNNSGNYYHPELGRKFGPDLANRAMLTCHQDLFDQVVALSLEELTDQLDAYAASTRVSKARMVESWKKLRPYRTTIPMDAPPISTEIFLMKLDIAVSLLEARLPFRIQ